MAMSKLNHGWNVGWWDVSYSAACVAAVVATAAAAKVALPTNRLRWKLWTAAAACWLAGQIAWNAFGVTGWPASPNPADLCWWAFAVLVIVSLVRSRAASRAVRLVTLVEVVPVVAAAISLSVAAMWHDAQASTLGLASQLSALVYQAVYIAAAVVMLQSLLSGSLRTQRTLPSGFVLAGTAGVGLAFSVYAIQVLANTYAPGATFVDPLFVVSILAIAMGGVLAARSPEAAAELNEPARHGGVLPGTMFALLLVANVEAQISHAAAGPADALRIGLLCAGAALILRATLLERRLGEMLVREQQALAALGEREVEMARLNAQLAEDSRRDPLTGMRNRRALSEDLARLEAGFKEEGRRFILALCDIDHFKTYNDLLGHLAGDQALRVIAATIRGAMRPGDIAYRFGGEEMLLVLRDLDEAEAVAAAERIRLAVRNAAIPHPDGIGARVSITIGVAGGEGDASEMLAGADAALYDGKHAGRNVVVASSSDAPSYAAGRRHRVVEEVVPRHLLSMLAVSREAASGHGQQAVLEALAATIRSELSFQVVSVNLLNSARHELTCKVVLGDDDCRAKLLGVVAPSQEIESVIANPEFQRLGATWVPAGAHQWEGEEWLWTPHTAAVPGADGWDPDDFLLLPLRAHDGKLLGTLSVDQPVSGRRPDDGQIALLMAVADHAGLALEQSQRETEHSVAVQEQSTELRLAAVMLLAETLDLRDSGTARHSRTVGVLARQTAEALDLSPGRVEQIHSAGVLHDLGKLGIADAILFKAGPLDAQEWREIRRHPEIGARILEHAGLAQIASWVRSHHERIDGHGYPDGLDGEQIPLEARILAVVDAYEAMIAGRPYRAGISTEAACDELLRCSGSQFDPVVVEGFINALAKTGTGTLAVQGVPVSS